MSNDSHKYDPTRWSASSWNRNRDAGCRVCGFGCRIPDGRHTATRQGSAVAYHIYRCIYIGRCDGVACLRTIGPRPVSTRSLHLEHLLNKT